MQFISRRSSTIFQLLHFHQNPQTLSSLRHISSTSKHTNQHSFTLSYLINSCGLSPESALKASKFVNLKTPQNPDAVLSALKSFGFSETQISALVKKYPRVLSFKSQEIILPKLNFFASQGVSRCFIVELFSSFPWIFGRSLNNAIIPCFNCLKDLLESNEKIFASIKRCHAIINCNHETEIMPKINFLLECGVAKSGVVFLLLYSPGICIMSLHKLKTIVEQVIEMGLDPARRKFVEAVGVVKRMSKCTWARKVDLLKKWGLSEEEILFGFRRQPSFMMTSENKLMAAMDLLVNELGWELSYVVKFPALFHYSLEKRLVPRAAVLQFLVSKRLVKKDHRPINIFIYTETLFLQKFVNCYEEAPELLRLYNEKLALSK